MHIHGSTVYHNYSVITTNVPRDKHLISVYPTTTGSVPMDATGCGGERLISELSLCQACASFSLATVFEPPSGTICTWKLL